VAGGCAWRARGTKVNEHNHGESFCIEADKDVARFQIAVHCAQGMQFNDRVKQSKSQLYLHNGCDYYTENKINTGNKNLIFKKTVKNGSTT
jgi:hypothetical protein